jgi:hypothetical protein
MEDTIENNRYNKEYIKKYKKKANRHIYYLKVLLFVVFIVLGEINLYETQTQYATTVFITIFNIAFTQNMLNNL